MTTQVYGQVRVDDGMSFKSLKKIFVLLILISSVLLSSQFIQASAEDVSSFGNSKDKIVSGYFNYKTNINNIYEGSPMSLILRIS